MLTLLGIFGYWLAFYVFVMVFDRVVSGSWDELEGFLACALLVGFCAIVTVGFAVAAGAL